MSRAVTDALSAAPPEDRDAGAVALAQRYAELIDESAPAAKYRKALALLGRTITVYAAEDPNGEQIAEAFETVRAALAEHSVASDLGPKLLATLNALGLTVAGRGARKDGGGSGGQQPRRNPLDELRAQP